MSTKLVQLGPDRHKSGTAALKISGTVAESLGDPKNCQIAILQPGASERYLHPSDREEPWKTAVYYIPPGNPRREGASLWLEIDHGVTYHLRANTPYKLRVRSLDVEAEEVFTMPADTRRPSTRPVGWTPPPDPRGPVAAPAAVPEALAPAPPVAQPSPRPPAAPEPVISLVPPQAPLPPPTRPPEAPPPVDIRSGGGRKWLVPVAVLALLAVGGVTWLVMGGGKPAPVAVTMDSCRQSLNADLDPAKAREQGEGLAKEGRLLDCQFLLFKHAAQKGDAVAARHMGAFYDPDTWSKDKSSLPAPNSIEAARWHKQAADAGDMESLYRYGMLLKLGRTDETDGPEKAQAYLQKAQAAGHPLAKGALTN